MPRLLCPVLLLCLTAAIHIASSQSVDVSVDGGSVASSISKGEGLDIFLNNSVPNAFFFFAITTTDSCGVDQVNITRPDGSMFVLYWTSGAHTPVSFEDNTPGMWTVYLHGVFSTCNISIDAPSSSYIPIPWDTPTNVTMLTEVPTILLINNTGTIPGLTDPFMLHADCLSNEFGSLYVVSVQDDQGTTSGAEVDSGESSYFGEGTRNTGYWAGAVFLFIDQTPGDWTITVTDRPLPTLIRNGPPLTIYASGNLWLLSLLLPPQPTYENTTLTLLDGDCGIGTNMNIVCSVLSPPGLVTAGGTEHSLTPNTPEEQAILPLTKDQFNQTCVVYFWFPQNGPEPCNFTVQLGIDQTASTLSLASTTSTASTTASTSATVSASTSSTASTTAATSTSARTTTLSASTTIADTTSVVRESTALTSSSATSTALATSTTTAATSTTESASNAATSAAASSSLASTTEATATTSASSLTTSTPGGHHPFRASLGLFIGTLVGAFVLGALIGGAIMFIVRSPQSGYQEIK